MGKTMRTAAQTAVLMAILVLVSKVFGFVREMVMANYFGTTYVTDAYVMANAVPSILFGGIVGAVVAAYMPIFSKIIEEKGEESSNKYTSLIINILLVMGIISAIMGMLFSNQIVEVFANGFTVQAKELTSFFIKVTFTYALVTGTIGVLNAYLQYKGVFIAQIIVGYTQSIFLVIFIIIGAITNHYFIIFGYVCAYTFQLLAYMVLAKKNGYQFSLNLKYEGYTKQIVFLAFPVFVGSMAGQIGQFVDKTLAAGLSEGSVSALNYGALLVGLITGLTVTIMNTLIYPKLNQANALKDYKRFNDLLSSGFVFIVIVTVPCTLGAMAYSQQIVQIVYERGAFGPIATGLTSTAFFYYLVGMPFNAVVSLLSSAYYSLHDTKTPAILGFIIVSVDVGLNFILIGPMEHGGLALATSIGAVVGGILYCITLTKKYSFIKVIDQPQKLIKIIVASFISVGVSLLFYQNIIIPFEHIVSIRMLQLMIAVIVAGVVYYILLRLLKIEELKFLKQIIRRNNERNY